ncbi:MAG TPA: transcriptional regulator [Lachnospiraceae bacterium]|nr:transcriptional regulator [Lachnospiraceae bacterium]
MTEKYCQSCGMPMGNTNEMYGSNKDGSKNEDYCKYCFENGAFTSDCTMDEMIEFCIPHMVKAHSDMTENKARSMMKEFFPTLKRWKDCIKM